jgi:hypothetical protein
MKLTIDRNLWLRGLGPDSCLLDSCGKSCALGFLAKDLGYSDAEILNREGPDYILSDAGVRFPDSLVKRVERKEDIWSAPTEIAVQIISTNDDATLNDLERESKIIQLFQKADIEVEFVG